MPTVEERLTNIENRNKKVESDKAWEGSWTRKLFVILFTYIAVGILMNAVKISNPWINAIIPSFGFLLSTMTLPFIKSWWIRNIHKA